MLHCMLHCILHSMLRAPFMMGQDKSNEEAHETSPMGRPITSLINTPDAKSDQHAAAK
jgi:hypothetical protein